MKARSASAWLGVTAILVGCSGGGGADVSPTPSAPTSAASSPAPTPEPIDGTIPVVVGEPIDIRSLRGRIVFDDFEDLFVMDADGSNVRQLTTRTGSEFDGAWSPDGRWIVYRDSRRGINEDDEIYVMASDGSGARNLTRNPANDWGPDWSPDGRTIVFNSDRDGELRGYLIDADGSNLRRIRTDVWTEYASFSPDGGSIVFTGHEAGDYDIYVADVATGDVTQLTDAPGSDGWPVWSPDGTTIAFTSERDDCLHADEQPRCWQTGEIGEHHDIWIMDADGSNERRVTPEYGQFVAWAPDGRHLLISGHSLYVIRADGTGRAELKTNAGGIPDWIG